MKLAIKSLKGELFHVEAELTDTVTDIKQKIEASKPDFAADRQKLIHSGKVLKDGQSLSELGLKETDFIVCMVSAPTKPKAEAPTAAAPTPIAPPAAAVRSVAATPPPAAAPIAAPVAPMRPAPATITVNPDSLAALVGMGFPESESRAALLAAQGNADLAYEFLLTGIPPGAQGGFPGFGGPASPAVTTPAAPTSSNSAIEQIRLHPQFNSLKQLVQQNPASLPQVLDLIGQQSPELLEAIHANSDAFVAMMNEPITNTPAAAPAAPAGFNIGSMMGGTPAGGSPNPAQITALLQALPQEQRAQFAQSVGMSPEQLQAFMQMMASMPPEQLEQMMPGLGGGGGGGGAGQTTISLTTEEMESVNRLMQLGFSQQQAVQAYLACDKNESLAANFLFDGGFDDDGADYDDAGDDYGDHGHY